MSTSIEPDPLVRRDPLQKHSVFDRDARSWSPMLRVASCGMLVIDSLLESNTFTRNTAEIAAIRGMVALSGRLPFPAAVSLLRAEQSRLSFGSIFSNDNLQLPVETHTSFDPWRSKSLVDRVQSWGRSSLIVLGRCSEACLTMASFGALERGYDTFVVVDAVTWPSSRYERIHLSRLEQAGVVAVSAKQVTFELFETSAEKYQVAGAVRFLKAHGLD